MKRSRVANHRAVRPALAVLGILALVLLGDRLAAMALQSLLAQSSNRFVRIYAEPLARPVVVLGNSRADRHFPPAALQRMLDRPVLNLGLGGVSTAASETLLRDIVERHGPPSLVLVEPTGSAVEAGALADLRLLAVFSPRFAAVLDRTAPWDGRAGRLFHLYRFNSPMLIRVLAGIGRGAPDRQLNARLDAAALASLSGRRPEPLSLDPANLAALDRIVALGRREGFPVRLVVTPYLAGHAPENLSQWLSDLRQRYGDRAPLADYTGLLRRPELFSDRLHMNRDGVAVLLRRMREDGTLGLPAGH